MKRSDKTEEQDRTILAERWAQAVADLDAARETLARAVTAEREAWDAIEQSRRQSVPSEES